MNDATLNQMAIMTYGEGRVFNVKYMVKGCGAAWGDQRRGWFVFFHDGTDPVRIGRNRHEAAKHMAFIYALKGW